MLVAAWLRVQGAEEGQEEDEEEWSDAQDSWEDEPIEAHLAAAGMQVSCWAPRHADEALVLSSG